MVVDLRDDADSLPGLHVGQGSAELFGLLRALDAAVSEDVGSLVDECVDER